MINIGLLKNFTAILFRSFSELFSNLAFKSQIPKNKQLLLRFLKR